MSCLPFVSNYNTPRIEWYQTDLTVVIRIQLTDVGDYYLKVEDDHLVFSTVKDDKKYYLILYLFGSVLAEKTVHKNIDREIKVYLTKTLKLGYPWLRLILSDEKNPFISYDAHHVASGSSTMQNIRENAENKPRKRPKYTDMNIMPAVSSSDEEDFLFQEYDFFCE